MGSEVITRRDLPHWYMPGAAHFVTYRLYGSLPREVLDELRMRRDTLLHQKPDERSGLADHRTRIHKQLFVAYDNALDQPRGNQYLLEPRVAAIIRSNLYHHHGTKYHLMAYCVMSNHVHVLFLPREEPSQAANQVFQAARPPDAPVGEQPDGGGPLSTIMHSLKSYTAHEANKILRRTGPFWQSESYDHWVRDDEELERIVDYIAFNPVKAGLVRNPQDWFFSSSHDRFLTDGDPSGWLHW
jgi:putative DNA methylase